MMIGEIWFTAVPPAQWEHIAYFFAGCITSGVIMGIANTLHNRFIIKSLPTIVIGFDHATDKQ